MRTKFITQSLVLVIILLFGFLAQAQTIDLAGNANCDGWSAMVTFVFPDGVFSAEAGYSMVLADQSGQEIQRFDHTEQVYRFEDPVMMGMYGDAWGLTLNSVYTAQLVFHFIDQESAITFDVLCGEEVVEPNPCRYSPGYWRNNQELWPVQTMAVGGLNLVQRELVAIMNAPIRGNSSLLMARELIAAKLNVYNGCDDSIVPSIEEADLFLVNHPLSEDRWRNTMRSSRDLRISLSVYNKAGCDELQFSDMDGASDLRFRTTAVQQTSFSSLKAMYR